MSQRSEKLRRQMAVLREDVDELKQRQAAAEQFFAALHSVTSQADRNTAVLLAEERKKTRRSEREARSWRLNAYLTLVLLVLTACVFLAVNAKADRAPVELAEEGWLPVVQHIQETDEQRSGARQSGLFDDADRLALARMVWGEARGCSTTEQAAVVWCVLNRFDSSEAYYADCMTICDIVTQESQFEGYNPALPVEADILAQVDDVLERWMVERVCGVNMGRVLPAEYLFFTGDGTENVFTTEWRGGETWDWSLVSPYEGVNTMYEQLSLFVLPPSRNGEYVEQKGQRLTWHDLAPGMTVIYDCSTQSHEWLMITTVQKIVQTPDGLRVILNGGRKNKPLINRIHIDTGSVKLYQEAS